MELGPQALLVIDAQVGIIDEPQVLSAIRSLLDRARARGTPVVYMQHEATGPDDILKPGRPEWEIHPQVAPLPSEPMLHKRSSDSFHRTDLDALLTRHGVRHIAICGCATDYCVDTTCRSALSHGYDVTLVEDAHDTGADGDLTAEQIIAHHNRILAQIAIEDRSIAVRPSGEIWPDA